VGAEGGPANALLNDRADAKLVRASLGGIGFNGRNVRQVIPAEPLEVRHYNPLNAAWPEHPLDFEQKRLRTVAVYVFQNVRMIDCVNGLIREREPPAQVVDHDILAYCLEPAESIAFEDTPGQRL
jgi:hypothetical protein